MSILEHCITKRDRRFLLTPLFINEFTDFIHGQLAPVGLPAAVIGTKYPHEISLADRLVGYLHYVDLMQNPERRDPSYKATHVDYEHYTSQQELVFDIFCEHYGCGLEHLQVMTVWHTRPLNVREVIARGIAQDPKTRVLSAAGPESFPYPRGYHSWPGVDALLAQRAERDRIAWFREVEAFHLGEAEKARQQILLEGAEFQDPSVRRAVQKLASLSKMFDLDDGHKPPSKGGRRPKAAPPREEVDEEIYDLGALLGGAPNHHIIICFSQSV